MDKAFEQLIHQTFYLVRRQGTTFLVKVLFDVHVEKLKNKIELVLAMHNVFKVDDVWVVKLLQKRNFANGCAWDSFVSVLKAYFLYSDNLICLFVYCFVNDTVSSSSEFLLVAESQVTLLWS